MRPPIQRLPLKFNKGIISPLSNKLEFKNIFSDAEPIESIATGKVMAKAWAASLEDDSDTTVRHYFIFKVIDAYWKNVHDDAATTHLPDTFIKIRSAKLDATVLFVAEAIGFAAAKLDVIEASFQLGNLYTAVLPESTRSSHGVFYTPPALTKRLIELSEVAGVNWQSARVIDPACGGGAFLAPVVIKMIDALSGKTADEIVNHVENHLKGFEIDPFGAWLSQVFLEVALKDVLQNASRRINPLVTVCNSLEHHGDHDAKFDLVIGNPPYGKLPLTPAMKKRFEKSLFGHPNLYGLFTHLATDLVGEDGIIGFLTPTSFLSGEYFKRLRTLIRSVAPPIQADFISFRKGVFEDVLQETMLTVYKKTSNRNVRKIRVNEIMTLPEGKLRSQYTGIYSLPDQLEGPWVLPRIPSQAKVVTAMDKMTHNLTSWGYQVCTGPLVWNRHKSQLVNNQAANTYPIIWSEAITQDGTFVLKAEKKNHKSFFRFNKNDQSLFQFNECVLLQRTTAKEQDKRLIAAVLPSKILKRYKAVVIENHLNVIIPIKDEPLVSLGVLSAFLNSKIVNDAFRTISGSVAVSAYELESLSLPAPEKLEGLKALLREKSDKALIEQECVRIFN